MREGQPKRSIPEALAPAPASVAATDLDITTLSPRHREALAKLEQGYELACSNEGFQQYLRVVSHLYAYSPRNVMLIFAQMPDATMVNAYERWQSAGRQVRKGERGLKIFYPQHRAVPIEGDDGEEERRQVLTGFGIGNVFDVSQTDGPPLEPPAPPDERFGTSDVAGALTDRLASFLIGEGLRVEQKPLAKVRGYFDPGKREIALNAALPRDDGWLKTLGHETAHYLAGDVAGWEGWPLREFVAESSAYAALLTMGVDTSGYSLDYITWWTREPGMVKTAMPEIAAVTRKLIAIMEGERPEAMGESAVSEHLTPHPLPEEEPHAPAGMPKTADYLHRFRGMWDTEPEAVCWVRVFEEAGQTPVIVMGEHPDNPSTSVTNMAELLAAELIQQHFPRRFDYEPPAILLEHYPTEYSPQGRVARKPTWDRLTFHSWAPRRVWLGGQERLAFGEPEWRSMPEHEVAALLGRDEMQARPPAPKQDDQPWTGVPSGA